MAEVSRIVRERLRGQVTAGEHPDANLLSAFAERTLTEQEQAQVLDHLSRCAECREALALSTPPQVEEERAAAAVAGRESAAARRSWWRSPVVHWGALTATAVVVLIAVGERMRLREGHSASAPAVAPYRSNQAAQKPTLPAPEAASVPEKESRKPAQTGKTLGHAGVSKGGKPVGALSDGTVGGRDRVATRVTAPSAVAANRAAPAPPPGAVLKKLPPPPAAPSGSATAAGTMEKSTDQALAKAAPPPQAAPTETVEMTAEAAPVLRREGAALSQRRSATFAARALLSPRWSISDSGRLQRSMDGGRSWKEVTVAEGVSFRAVATVGDEVWAGGSSGALFHSTDGGEHWARVRVQANGHALSGDIVRIEFTDTADGVVATSSGETWTTSDAGVTWRR